MTDTASLLLAVKTGQTDIVQAVLEQAVDITQFGDKGGYAALLQAIKQGHVEIVKLLLSHKLDFNRISRSGVIAGDATPLILAINAGYCEIVNILLMNDASVNQEDEKGKSPLFLAVEKGNIEIVKLLVLYKAQIDCLSDFPHRGGIFALMYASQHGHADLVKILLDAGARADRCTYYRSSALSFAAIGGHLDVVTLLLANKATTTTINKENIWGKTPLFLATQSGHIKVVEALLLAGADVNQCADDGTSPLAIAAESGRLDIVNLLLTHQAIIDKANKSNGETPLIYAISSGQPEVVKALLAAGADVNQCTLNGETPLMIALKFSRTKCVRILIEHGAKSEIPQKYLDRLSTEQTYLDYLGMVMDPRGLRRFTIFEFISLMHKKNQISDEKLHDFCKIFGIVEKLKAKFGLIQKTILEYKADYDTLPRHVSVILDILKSSLAKPIADVLYYNQVLDSIKLILKANKSSGFNLFFSNKPNNPALTQLEKNIELILDQSLDEVINKNETSIALQTGQPNYFMSKK